MVESNSVKVSDGRKTPFLWIDACIWEMQLSPYEAWAYSRIVYRAGKNSSCFEAKGRMAKACGMGLTKFREAISGLERKNMIVCVGEIKHGNGATTNEYQITDSEEWIKPPTPTRDTSIDKNTPVRSANTPPIAARVEPCSPHKYKQDPLESDLSEIDPLILSDTKPVTEQTVVEPIPDKKQKGVASQNEKPKSDRKKKKYEVTDADREELQVFLDIYNQEKPERWDKCHQFTHSRVTNLRRYIDMFGDCTIDTFRRGLMGAKRHKVGSYDWNMDTFIKPDNDWMVVLSEKVSPEVLDSPIAAHIQSPQDDKRARILERTARAVHRNLTGVAS
jgi:hypothetical protein